MKICRTIPPTQWLVISGWGVLNVMVLLCSGCQSSEKKQTIFVGSGAGTEINRIRISTLTAFEANPDDPDKLHLKVLVELFDPKDIQIEIPCVLRFELYDFQTLSSNWRGQRLILWPDQNLTSIENNEAHWKDYLKAYEFYLPIDFKPQSQQQYVLEATCLFGEQRFTDLIKLSL